MTVLCYFYLRLNDFISAIYPQYGEYKMLKTALNMAGSNPDPQSWVALDTTQIRGIS
jgi:hypothetical protein